MRNVPVIASLAAVILVAMLGHRYLGPSSPSSRDRPLNREPANGQANLANIAREAAPALIRRHESVRDETEGIDPLSGPRDADEALGEHEAELAQLTAAAEQPQPTPSEAASPEAAGDDPPLTLEAREAASAEHERVLETLRTETEQPQLSPRVSTEELLEIQAIEQAPAPSQDALAAWHEHEWALEVLRASDERAEPAAAEPPLDESLKEVGTTNDATPLTEEQLAAALAEHEAALERLSDY